MNEHGVRVIHRNPGAHDQMSVEVALRRHGPEWKRERRKAPVDTSIGDSPCAIYGSPFGLGHRKRRRTIDQSVTSHVAVGYVVGIDGSGVKEAEVRGIDIAFQALQPVAFGL